MAGSGSSSDKMDPSDPLVTSVVKIEIDIAEEPPVCRWTETDHKGQGGAVVSLSLSPLYAWLSKVSC